MGFVKNRKDIRSLLFLGLTFGLFASSLFFDFAHFAILQFVAAFLILSFLVFIVSVINHNHRHCEIFENRFLNEATNFLITICIGAPSTRLHQVHLLNHHRYYRSQKDWTSHLWIQSQRGLPRIVSYIFNGAIRIRKHRSELSGKVRVFDQALRRERFFLAFALVIGLLLNYRVVLFLWLPAWAMGLTILFVSNLLNHDSCELESSLDHSRDFTNPIENYFLFNNGFHTAHHLKPSLHWGDLAELHKTSVAPMKKNRFICGSFLVFVLFYLSNRSRGI